MLVEDTCLCFKAMNDLPGPYMYCLPPFPLSVLTVLTCSTASGSCSPSARSNCTRCWPASTTSPHRPCAHSGTAPDLAMSRSRSRGVRMASWCRVEDLLCSVSRCSFPNNSRGCANRQPGWDSCFEYVGTGQTYAEMDKAEKNKISHRGKALEKLKEWLASRTDA